MGARRSWAMAGLAAGLMAATSVAAQSEPRADWNPNIRVMAAFDHAIAAAPLVRRLVERRDAYYIGETVWGEPISRDNDDLLLEELSELTAEAERAEALRVDTDALAQACVDIRLKNCVTSLGGYLNLAEAEEAPRRLFWQIQNGFTENEGVQGGWVLLEAEGRRLRPVMWDFGAAWYEAPVFMGRDEHGRELIALPGRYGGTGSHNADVVLAWTPDQGRGSRWAEIETWSWTGYLENHLPEGLEIWKGVTFNWPDLMATTDLWRPHDANCCPTGGSAVLTFEIIGDRLTLKEARVSPTS